MKKHHGEGEGRDERNVRVTTETAQLWGPGVRRSYHVMASSFTGPLNWTAVLRAYHEHDCLSFDCQRHHEIGKAFFIALTPCFLFVCFYFVWFFLPLGTQQRIHRCSAAPFWFSSVEMAGSGQAHCPFSVTLASSVVTGFINFSELAPSSKVCLHLS